MQINEKSTISVSIIVAIVGLGAGFTSWLTVLYADSKANANSIRYLEEQTTELRSDIKKILENTAQIRQDLSELKKE